MTGAQNDIEQGRQIISSRGFIQADTQSAFGIDTQVALGGNGASQHGVFIGHF